MTSIVRISNIPALPAFNFLSAGVGVGRLLFVSGQVGLRPNAVPEGHGRAWSPGELAPDFTAQTRQALDNMLAVVRHAGSSPAQVIKVNAYIHDIDNNFHIFNDIYVDYFGGDPPARTAIEVKLYKDILVEVECIAWVPEGGEE